MAQICRRRLASRGFDMAVPSSIATEVSALNTAFVATGPIEAASQGAVTALANQAIQLVNDIDTALIGVQPLLDMFTPPVMAPALVLDFLSAVDQATMQLSLADLAGVAGRIASNLANA